MDEKIFARDGKATFVCPSCGFSAIQDVSRFLEIKTSTRMRCTCKQCRHTYAVLLERRRFVRKSTFFKGLYSVLPKSQIQGAMTVVDISRTGLKVQIPVYQPLFQGDILGLEFRLDRGGCPLIHREAIVRTIHDRFVGLEFLSKEHTDPLGPYLAFL